MISDGVRFIQRLSVEKALYPVLTIPNLLFSNKYLQMKQNCSYQGKALNVPSAF